jgi:hypothetical protein
MVLAGLAGCVMAPDIAMKLTTADGVDIQVPLNTEPEPITDGVITLEPLHIAPWNLDADGKATTLAFTFLVQFKQGYKPANILVEDVTEEPILEVYQDNDPTAHFSKLSFWGGVSKPFAPPDEHVKWMLTEDNTVRVYRFTIKTSDGVSHVLREPLVVSMRMKATVRSHLAKE